MAVRLSVIMVHSPPAGANAHQLAEAIVGEMIGRPGIDMTLVERLDRIDADSTDRLTLDSITGDTAVLDWREPVDLMQTLQSNGFDGTRAVHASDPGAEQQPHGRKVYAFDLSRFSDPAEVCSALMKLLADRQVRTFSLGKISGGQPAKAPGTAANTPNSRAKIPPQGDSVSRPAIEGKVISDQPAQTPQSIDLDDLVDQLDALDP